ncbi:MAG: peptidylprolyl isomerase [Sulfurospirillaceae bacterium]|nr:peptidylprolyl isomerase [Sulfurospirillaceae bacterium]MDD2825805.1 peptidylprolyl isomerase [Sulfurospirillaceae bacterium]
MITWMQRHKKYLVITIWISTIAFVGAGFVGWGAYDLNKDRAASVAKVGNQTISVQEFQTAYANFYSFYNNMLGGKLTQEQADQMGIDKMVMSNLINQTLLLNYANDMGIIATENDIKEVLKNNANFQEDGAFNKNIYYAALKSRRMTPSDYENGLKKDIIINKLQSFLKLSASETEINLFASAFFMEDKLAISPVTLDASDIVIKENDIKAFWEKNKANYLTKKSFNLELIKFPLSTNPIDEKALEAFFEQEKYNYKHDDGKLMSFEEAKDKALIDLRFKNDKKAALETYLAFRDGKIPATDTKVIYEDDTTLPVDKIQVAAKNEVLKPVPVNDGYVIIKVKEIQLPEPMSYEMAKKIAYNDLLTQTKATALDNKAQARLSTFNGSTVGFVSRDTVKSIAGLTEAKSAEFLSFVFDNTVKKGYKIVDDKAILYEVLEQKLLNEEKAKQYVSMISENVAQVKQTELNQNLIKKLASQYKVEQFYKGK